jgi:cullin-associated NEDD8-dissociated protein 1
MPTDSQITASVIENIVNKVYAVLVKVRDAET